MDEGGVIPVVVERKEEGGMVIDSLLFQLLLICVMALGFSL